MNLKIVKDNLAMKLMYGYHKIQMLLKNSAQELKLFKVN